VTSPGGVARAERVFDLTAQLHVKQIQSTLYLGNPLFTWNLDFIFIFILYTFTFLKINTTSFLNNYAMDKGTLWTMSVKLFIHQCGLLLHNDLIFHNIWLYFIFVLPIIYFINFFWLLSCYWYSFKQKHPEPQLIVLCLLSSSFVGCNLTGQDCEIVSSALQSSNSVLRELDLSNNDLRDSGVKIISDGLKSPNCQLQILRYWRTYERLFTVCRL